MEECVMPVTPSLILLISVIAAAGVTIALVWAMGLNLLWLGLAALVLALLVRTVPWQR